MFKSSGYFKGLNCPYYQSGLCERAHCHFRHVKDETSNGDTSKSFSRSTSVDSATASTNSFSLLQKPDYSPLSRSTSLGTELAVLEESIEKEKEILEIKTSPLAAKTSSSKVKCSSKHSEYTVDSPSVSKKNKVSFKDKFSVANKSLQYKPTPKAELAKQKPKEPTNKYSLNNLEPSCSELEYDPLFNYSTPVANYSDVSNKRKSDDEDEIGLPLKKTKVSFAVEEEKSVNDDVPEDNACNDDSESVESFDPGARFSEDDSDNEEDVNKQTESSYKEIKPVSTDSSENKESTNKAAWSGLIYNLNSSELPDIFFSSDSAEKDIFNDITSAYSSDKNNKDDQSESSRKKSSGASNKSSSVSKDKRYDHRDKKQSDHSSKSKSTSKSTSSSVENRPSSSSDKSDRKHRHSSSETKEKDSSSHNSKRDKHSSVSSSSNKKERHSSAEHSKKDKHSSQPCSENNKNISLSVSKNDKSSSEKVSTEKTSKVHRSSSKDKSHKDKHVHSNSSSEKHHRSSHHDSKSKSHSSSSNKHSSSSHHKNHSNSHSSTRDKHKHPESTKKKDKDESKSTPRKRKNSTGKEKIISLNVDLFGVDSDTENAVKEDKLQELSDLSDDGCENNIDNMYYDKFLDNDDFAEEDTYDECLKIFKEDVKPKPSAPTYHEKRKNNEAVTPCSSTSKQRVAHNGFSESKNKDQVKTPVSRMTPAQVMHNRFVEMQEKALAAVKARNERKEFENKPGTSLLSAKNRVAHKPKEDKTKHSGKNTKVGTSKSEGRQSHMTTPSNIKRPTIPAEFGSKIATNIRQRYLNLIIDECLKIYCDEEIAYSQALEQEMEVYKRSATKSVYLNVAVNAIKRLRLRSSSKSEKNAANLKSPTRLSHETVLGGSKAFNTSFTLHRSGGGSTKVVKDIENFTGVELYKRLSAYLLSEEQLRENGFPRPDNYIAGRAVLYREEFRKQTEVKLKNHEKICCRCGKRFTVYPNGHYQIEEECIYHWGKCWKKRVAGTLEARYTCCQADIGAEGCQVARLHVHQNNQYEDLTGYMRTMPSSPPIDGDYGVCAMDCEMIYTSKGNELARVTVIGADLKPIYESFVKPEKEVIDYNTRFSGITEDDLKDVTTTLTEVQAVLMNLFMAKTIVIGHSLESDLIALKMIHSTVVDTSVVYPHKMGPPFKRALKTLMSEYLMKIIQDDVGGHDSQEDAVSCMQLMHHKLKEEYKKESRKT